MRTIQDLNLCDDFLFHEVMKDESLAISLLEVVLDLKGKIKKLVYLEGEKTIKESYSGKGVRLDVYVEDESLVVYNVEIQQRPHKAIGKRSREYQSSMDMRSLKKGRDYDKLNKQYVIFICCFDPFGKALHRYTFSNLCHEDHALSLGDEALKVFLNTKGTADDVTPELREFLAFVEDSTMERAKKTGNPFLLALAERIEQIKEDEEIGGFFMTFEQKLRELQRETREETQEEDAFNYARKMKAKGYPLADIQELTGLSEEEIQAL